MAETGDIRDLIRAAAEGATGGLTALRAAGVTVDLADFAVEIDYAGSTPDPELAASVRLRFAVAAGSGAPPS